MSTSTPTSTPPAAPAAPAVVPATPVCSTPALLTPNAAPTLSTVPTESQIVGYLKINRDAFANLLVAAVYMMSSLTIGLLGQEMRGNMRKVLKAVHKKMP